MFAGFTSLAEWLGPFIILTMNLEALTEEIKTLNGAARRRLMALLVSLDDADRDGHAARMAGKVDDKNPENWISLEDAEQKLGL